MDGEIDQRNSLWLDQYRTYAWAYFQSLYGGFTCHAYILAYLDDDTDEVVAKGKICLPTGSLEMIDSMCYCSKYIDDYPLVVGNLQFDGSTKTFSLAQLLASGYPMDGKGFKNNTAGSRAGRMDHLVYSGPHPELAPEIISHTVFGGLCVLLMDECRATLMPFGSLDEVVSLTRNMFLTFEDCGG